EVEQALARDLYAAFAGFAAADARFRVEHSNAVGGFGSKRAKLDLGLVAKDASVIDRVRWIVTIEQRKPSSTWSEFLTCFDAAESCAERESWLAAWKRSGTERSILIEVVDHRAYDAWRDDPLVKPAWSDAGFPDAPEAELMLWRGDTLAGKVYVSR